MADDIDIMQEATERVARVKSCGADKCKKKATSGIFCDDHQDYWKDDPVEKEEIEEEIIEEDGGTEEESGEEVEAKKEVPEIEEEEEENKEEEPPEEEPAPPEEEPEEEENKGKKDDKPECPECGSERTVHCGHRKSKDNTTTKQRHRCNDCGYRFVEERDRGKFTSV